MSRHFAIVAAVACLSPALTSQSVTASFEQRDVLAQRIADTDGDGKHELVLVQAHTREHGASVQRVDLNNDKLQLRDRVTLPDPTHTLLAIKDVHDSAGDELVICDGSGARCALWTTAATDEPEMHRLVRRARFRVRVDQPQLSPFVSDLNQDGLLDLLLPGLDGVTPYLCERDGDATAYRRLPKVPVPISTSVDTGSGGLDQEFGGSISIAQISTEDVNGDGRPDLLTQQDGVHAFHLQKDDGTFAEAIEVDIKQFEDSTPKAVVDLGNTVVLGDRQMLQRGDINGDKIPDYVIAHRRKIWTFLASNDGPQFRKARTQAVADDVTFMLVVDLDADDRADLLTFRVKVPSFGALLLALVQSIDVDIKAVGYASAKDGFESKPKWRRTVTLRVPPLLSLLSQQDELIERFTTELGKTRISVRGDFRGGDDVDLMMANTDGSALELLHDVGEAPTLTSNDGKAMLRRLLFEDPNTLFDLDRVFSLISGVLDQLSARMTGNGTTTATIPTRNRDDWYLTNLLTCEADGQPGDELIAVYRSTKDDRHRAYDLITW